MAHDRSRCIHREELLLLALLLVLLAKGIINDLGLTSCLFNNIGLVLLILLGWELRVIYHSTMCIRHPYLVCLDFMPSLHSIIISRIFSFT